MVGKVAFPGWDSKFLVSGVEEGNQSQGKSLASPYKYHPDYCNEGSECVAFQSSIDSVVDLKYGTETVQVTPLRTLASSP